MSVLDAGFRVHSRDEAASDGLSGHLLTDESTLITMGTKSRSETEVRRELDRYKHVGDKTFSDDGYFRVLVAAVFFSGFKAATVGEKMTAIYEYFSDYDLVTSYDEANVERMLQDPRTVRNPRRIRYCIRNAHSLQKIVGEYESFEAYLQHFGRAQSFQDLMLLREDLMWRFKGLGTVTVGNKEIKEILEQRQVSIDIACCFLPCYLAHLTSSDQASPVPANTASRPHSGLR